MTTKTKRYEIQQYDWRNTTWYPVATANMPSMALRRLQYGVRQGYYTRIVDMITKAVAEAGKPLRPKYDCDMCADTKEVIIDSADHHGEHVQDVSPCECTL